MTLSRNGWATTTKMSTAWNHTIPKRNWRRKTASFHRTWNSATTAPTNTRKSAALRLVELPPTRWTSSDPGSAMTTSSKGSATKMPMASTAPASARPMTA